MVKVKYVSNSGASIKVGSTIEIKLYKYEKPDESTPPDNPEPPGEPDKPEGPDGKVDGPTT